MSGHLGVNKMYPKVSSDLYWLGLGKDVVQFSRYCHTCQMVGKPNQPLPALEEPLSMILVDSVGPLLQTKSGNPFMLTTCASTRFPEAIPLIKLFFSLVGLPKLIQSDKGYNFMSSIFQQAMYELGI